MAGPNGGLKVNHEAMATAAQTIEEKANIIKGLQVTLDGHRGELMAGWGGEAAMTFNQVHDEFNTDFTQVLSALQAMYEKLTHLKLQYVTQEEESTKAVSDVQRLLGGG